MDLITRDGKCFISKQDYEALHILHKKLPEYMDTAEVLIKVCACNDDKIKERKDTVSKFRRHLGEIREIFKKMSGGG